MRILLGGLLGGLVIFFAGAVVHTALNWEGRTFKEIPDEPAFREWVKGHQLGHGVYGFPGAGAHDMSDEDWKKLGEIYKEGPNGILFVGRTGEEMMSSYELVMEFASNVVVATFAAFIVARLNPRASFGLRWFVVVVFGVSAWFSISVSHAIWYRFYWPFVMDQLYCTLVESVLAGIVIAAIVKPGRSHPAVDNV